jgi:ATP-dependent DNA helicase RecG
MMWILIGFITTPILWIWGIVDAYSKSRVRAFNAPPYSRNPHIALAVQRMGWIEEKGSGLARMRDSMMTHGLRSPVFDFVDGYFVVMLPGHDQAWATVRVGPGLLAKLEQQQQRIIDLVMTRGRLATSECAKELNVDVATARRHLRKLVDKGLLESRGSGPRLAYYLAGAE